MKYAVALALVAFLSACAAQPPVVDNFIHPTSAASQWLH